MKCIIFEKDGKRYFEGDAPFLTIISEKEAKIIP